MNPKNHKILYLDLSRHRLKNEANKKRILALVHRFGNVYEEKTMLKKDKPETLIQLLAAYRQASFPKGKVKRVNLVKLARTLKHNCAATAAFAGEKLKRITEDGEEAFSLYEVREEALRLGRKCAKVGRNKGSGGWRKEVESLRLEYDNFTGSVRHMVRLLDPSLGERLDEIL